MNRAYRFVIDSDGTIIGTPDKTLRGFSDNVEEIVVISPFDSSYVGSFGVGTFNKPSVSQYLSVSSDVVSDWVEATETFGSLDYQDIADWTVRRIALKRATKLYISSKRGGSVFFSFKFGTIGLNDKTITYKGTFGRDHLLPTTLQVSGDYYECEDLYYTQTVDTKNNVALTFGHGMYVYWGSGGYWVKVSENLAQDTPSYEVGVDPSFAVNDEVDEDEINYLLSFESVLYDHEARIDQAELDIVAIEQDIVDLEVGLTVIPTYELLTNKAPAWGTPDDTKYPTTKLVDDRLNPIETFKDTTVPATYETIANADIHRTRTTSLENANMVKSVTRTGTDLLTLTKYDNTTLAVVTLAELKRLSVRLHRF